MTRVSAGGHTFDLAGFSEQGPRNENQDAYLIEGFTESGLVAVADGMGGEKSGRVAADTALRALRGAAPLRSLDEVRRAVREADREVASAADANPELHGGMGCALGVLALSTGRDGPGWIAAHVGDVRILSRSPDGILRLETRDHTPAFARWEAGEISLDEIADSTGANRLQRAIGRGGEADVTWLPIGPGWSWLIVSDGIYKAMRLDELSAALGEGSVEAACRTIRRKVEERGADDNFTAVIVHVAGGAAAPAPHDPDATQPMSRTSPPPAATRRGGVGAGLALALALIALLVAGFAMWTAYEGAGSLERAELDRLRTEVDSLRVVVDELNDPFGPVPAPAPAPQGAPTQTPPPE
jgi:serine/threonine protein phosphatase PrpC